MSYSAGTDRALLEFQGEQLVIDTVRLPPGRLVAGHFVVLVGEVMPILESAVRVLSMLFEAVSKCFFDEMIQKVMLRARTIRVVDSLDVPTFIAGLEVRRSVLPGIPTAPLP